MRRWNGWGDTQTKKSINEDAQHFLRDAIGPGRPRADAALGSVVATVPDSRLPENGLVDQSREVRVRHARGQSLPDWVAMRSGQLGRVPDGVAFPETAADVRAVMNYAQEVGAKLIPYGGGTSVAGHINPPSAAYAPILTVNMSRLNRMIAFDARNGLATFGAGITGPDLEAHLRADRHTLGHFPQSFELSTLGGWVATRSSGQQSLHYGRIEDLFAGGRMTTPAGTLSLRPHPASAAGPDVRHAVLGSEGRMGIITEATVRVRSLPEYETFYAVMFPTFAAGQTAVRQMAQNGIPLSMLRLSTAVETATNLAMAGRPTAIAWLERYLRVWGAGDEKSMLLMGSTGPKAIAKPALRAGLDVARRHGGVRLGRMLGDQWRKNRFTTPYLRNTLWDLGYAIDTVETAVNWGNVDETIAAVEDGVRTAAGEFDERVHIFTHLSHVYTSGSSVYTSYVFPRGESPGETLAVWRKMKKAASEAIVAQGGTISHQHGVGRDHAPYLAAEKGRLGMKLTEAMIDTFDPDEMMNPGVLLMNETDEAIPESV